jgi:hypothetical protein
LKRLLTSYALSRATFGCGALLIPAATGRALSGSGGATPDAQAFLRGMGGREIGIAGGLLSALRVGASPLPWLAAGILSDFGDIAGIAGAWGDLPPGKRVPGIAFAGAAAMSGVALGWVAATR